jgi:stearoyl-CoA desaturase (delta-9 desaturase)
MEWLTGLASWINARAIWPHWPAWAYLTIALLDTHVTTACVTLYLHRSQTHRSITFHPIVEHFMRAWLWLRTAMPTKEWVAVHRCHHAHVDTDEDPHSPIFYGIWRVLFLGTTLYHRAAHNGEILAQYGKGTPEDTPEWVYTSLTFIGPIITLLSNMWLFGAWGFGMWLIQMAWIPFFAAGVINGLGHWWGYRNFDTPDHSKNLPGQWWAVLTCGESLHNNHHHVQNSPRFSVRPGEIDLGYRYFQLLRVLGLAQGREEARS